MQIQRSLFSFYKVFVRKTPFCVWAGLAALFSIILLFQIGLYLAQEPVYNFDTCFMQYFNATRPVENSTEIVSKDDLNQQGKTQQAEKQKTKMPFHLRPEYFNVMNQTSTIKLYLVDDIEYKEGQPSCKIILNTQKIQNKVQQSNKQKGTEEKDEQKLTQKVATLLQQIQIDEQTQQTKADPSKQQQQQLTSQKIQKPENVKNYDQITPEQRQILTKKYPNIQLTANNHVIYLDQRNEFQQKHGIQVHSIILSRQKVQPYPTILGISTKLWRFHGNQEIQANANIMKTLAQSFYAVKGKVLKIYEQAVIQANLVTSLKQIAQKLNQESEKQNRKQNQKQNSEQSKSDQKGNLSKEPQNQQQAKTRALQQVKQNSSPQQIQAEQQVQPTAQQNPSDKTIVIPVNPNKIPLVNFNPLSKMRLYFHSPPQVLRTEDITEIVSLEDQEWGLLWKIIKLISAYSIWFILSALVGLVVRMLFLWMITLFLVCGGCFLNNQWGWIKKYFNIIKNRINSNNQVFLISSIKMLILFAIASVGILGIFTLGSKYIVQNLYLYVLPFSQNYYSEMFIKNFFIIELFYFVCCRTRLSLRFYPIISLIITLFVLIINEKLYMYNISWFLNLHLWLHLLTIWIFCGLENLIGNSQFKNDFTPSEDKPRAVFFIGYDISWENSIPPIWTYFTTQYDLTYFNQNEKSLINRDYQLLYGRLLGMNDRQELPQDNENNAEDQVHNLNQNLSQSNEMGLIR